MPNYTNARYYNDLFGNRAGISVDINGALSFVPIEPANTDYANMMALVAAGEIVIASAN